MKPEKIILVRHGESAGNVDRNAYLKTPDYALDLTERGRVQASNAGDKIKQIIGDESAFFYVSPFNRTRRTFEIIARKLEREKVYYREDPRLREQEWQTRIQGYDAVQDRGRKQYGHFYYRFEGGESVADVYDRMSSLFDSIHRDFQKASFPKNCVFITHGMTMRVFLMRWFHMTVEEFELLRNPPNCAIIILNKNSDGKYELEEPLKKDGIPEHQHQYPIRL